MDTGTVIKAMTGDREAFSAMVVETRKGLLGLAMSRIGNIQAAEDVVQEAYMKAYRRMGDLRRPDRALPWLRQIVVNEASTYLRSQQMKGSSDIDGGIPEIPDHSRVDDSLSGIMSNAIRRLPPAGREAVVLVKLLGLTPGDAANLLEISRSAIDVRLNRAMKALRREISVHMDKTMEEMMDESRAYCARIAGRVAERLESEEPREIRSISRELRLLATRANIAQMAKDLESSIPGRTKEAARAARETGDLRILPSLCKAMEACEDPTTLIDLVKAIGDIRHPDGIGPLRNLIRRTAYADVISAARDGIDTLKVLQGIQPRDISVTAEDLIAAGLDYVLMDMASHPDKAVAMDALEGLGRLGSPKAIPIVLKAFSQPDPLVRLAAAHCLGALGKPDEEAVACLRRGLSDEAEPVAMASAEALTDLGDTDSAPLMAERFMAYSVKGPVPWVMGEAMARLLQQSSDMGIRDRAIGRIIGYLADPMLQIRNCTCFIIRKCATHGYTAYNDVILEAAGLPETGSGKPSMPGLDRLSLYTALAISGDTRGLPGLLWSMANSDKAGREMAGNAIAQLGSPGSRALREFAGDTTQPAVGRISTIEALEGLAGNDIGAMRHLEELAVELKGEIRFGLRASLALKRVRMGGEGR